MVEIEETWKDIEGYNGNYKISNMGRIFTNSRKLVNMSDRMLHPYIDNGYLCVSLLKDGKKSKARVHRLIALYFIPNPENKPFINHIDGQRDNNKIENLEWCTQRENICHAYSTGLASNNFLRKKVINIKTGEIYNSITEASKFVRISNCHLTKILKKKEENEFNLKNYEE